MMDGALSFNDVFKKSILELQNFVDISLVNVLICLLLSLAVGLFIFSIYKITFKGVVYSENLNSSLVLLTMITALVIMTISSNIVLSLGMVGALSIVRFRAAIKDPRDIVFMFWAISAGIASGAGIFTIAVGGSLFIGIVMIIMARQKFEVTTYLLIVKYDDLARQDVLLILNRLNYTLKSKTVAFGKTESTFELRKVGDNTSFVEQLSNIEGVESAVLVKYNGDYAE